MHWPIGNIDIVLCSWDHGRASSQSRVQERALLGSGQPQDVAPDVVLLQMCSCKLMVGNMFMPC